MMSHSSSEQANRQFSRFESEILENRFYRDVMTFLQFVETREPLLTQTKNINLRFLAELNPLLLASHPMGTKIGDRTYRVRSQDDMPYLRGIDYLCATMELTMRPSQRLKIVPEHKEQFDSFAPPMRFASLWFYLTRRLVWTYVQYIENHARIATILQPRQDEVWDAVRDLSRAHGNEPIQLALVLESLRESFDIHWETAYGENHELAHWGIRHVIWDQILLTLDIITMDLREKREEQTFAFTPLGRAMVEWDEQQVKAI